MRRRVPGALVGLVAVASLVVACGGEAGRSDGSPQEDPATGAPEPVERTDGPGAGSSARHGEAAPGQLAVAEFAVEGMTCGGCAIATEMAVKELDGVISADAEYDEATGSGRCTVEYDPRRVDPGRIMAAIRKAGFDPRLREGSTG